MSSSISRVILPSLESQCRNTTEIKCVQLYHFYNFHFGGCNEIMALIGKWCPTGLSCYYYISEISTLSEKMLSKQICLKSALGEKTSLLLWGASCSSSSILSIAIWMFLLTAHLCADWAVKILSSCFEWTGSHIQGHYASGVRKIKH